jgi:hypothetical protein
MRKQKTIRFASKAAYEGNTATPSVKGYWTIWETKADCESGIWEMVGQPKPVKINVTFPELVKYASRFPLWQEGNNGLDGLFRSYPVSCRNCGKEWTTEGDEKHNNDGLCWHCRLALSD